MTTMPILVEGLGTTALLPDARSATADDLLAALAPRYAPMNAGERELFRAELALATIRAFNLGSLRRPDRAVTLDQARHLAAPPDEPTWSGPWTAEVPMLWSAEAYDLSSLEPPTGPLAEPVAYEDSTALVEALVFLDLVRLTPADPPDAFPPEGDRE